ALLPGTLGAGSPMRLYPGMPSMTRRRERTDSSVPCPRPGAGSAPFRTPSSTSAGAGRFSGRTRQDGAMTAPDNESPQQVVVVGPDGRPVGTMAMPMGADDGDGDGGVGGMVEEPA